MGALCEPGHSDGQRKLVRDGTNVFCYSWSAADKKWVKIGDVVGASGGTQATSGKQLYNGKVESTAENDLNWSYFKLFKAKYLISASFMNIFQKCQFVFIKIIII